MKWKEIAVTILACVVLIVAGTVAFSLLYQTLFHPDSIIGDDSEDPIQWQEEQEQYENAILDPLSFALETGILLQVEAENLFSDFYHISRDVYSSVLELAETTWEEIENAAIALYEYKSGTKEYDVYGLRYLFHIISADNDMIISVDKNDMPVLFLYWAETGSDVGSTVSTPVPEDLRLADYLAQIDTALRKNISYRKLIIAFECDAASENETSPGSFETYYGSGEWKFYSGTRFAAYVCIVNDYHFILYYDLKNECFCGYSIAMNALD